MYPLTYCVVPSVVAVIPLPQLPFWRTFVLRNAGLRSGMQVPVSGCNELVQDDDVMASGAPEM